MAENDNIGLFSQFGIDTRSEEAKLAEQSQLALQNALQSQQGRGRFPGDQDLREAGAFLGAFLVNKFGKKELTPEQKMQAAMTEHAKTKLNQRMQDDPEFRAQLRENPALAGIETIRLMSDYAFQAGDIALASELSMEAGQRLIAHREAMTAQQEAGLRIQETQQRIQIAGNEEARKLGETTAILAPNQDGRYDLEDIEGQIITGRYDVEKKAFVDDTGQEIDNFITLEEAISLRELALEEMDDAGVETIHDLSFEDRTRLFFAALGQSERGGIRAQMDALGTQDAIMNRVADMFEEFVAAGNDPAQFLDGAGKITAFATDLGRTAKSLGQTANFFTSIATGTDEQLRDGKGEVVAAAIGSEKFNEAYSEEIAAIQFPAGVDKVGDAAAEYQSAIIQLAYAVARSNEPGARQLSDTDFRNALKEIGAAAADPERLRRVILANFARKADSINKNIKRVGEIAETVGLNAETGRSLIAGTQTRRETLDRFNDTRERFTTLTDDLTTLREAGDLDAAGVGRPEQVDERNQDNLSFFTNP